MRIRKTLTAALALGALVALAACQGQNEKNQSASDHFKKAAGEITQGAKEVASNVASSASDAALTTRVKTRLASHQGLSSFSIHVSTDKGVVTLSGTVGSRAASELAAQVASKTDGVRIVINKLKVQSGGS